MWNAAGQHWPEYLMEAAGLGFFMMSAARFATRLQYPGSPLYRRIHSPAVRNGIVAVPMGLTTVAPIDGSFFVSSGVVNPGLTIIANAIRVGDHLLERLR